MFLFLMIILGTWL